MPNGPESQHVPPIRFAEARGTRLAYQDFGDGPATILSIPPTAQNIEMAWERPEIRYMLDRFASFGRFIVFDKRGTGCSDRRSRVNVVDERIEDVRAVLDAAEVDRAHFFVQSEGGPMALLFAATYPDRVLSLTFHGSYAGLVPPDITDEELAAGREGQALFVRQWGTPDSQVVDRFAPSLAGDPEYRAWHQRYERNAASTESLAELLDLSIEMDAREVLADLDVPTLVIHRVGDRVVPIERGRELATTIPGARLLEVSGEDHFCYAGDVDEWLDAFEDFVTGTVQPRPTTPTTATRVRIVTLGRFGVEVDGQPVPTSAWGSRRARQLCKRLVAARGWPVTRDELIDLLWPDETDRSRLGARLSVQLSAVRRILGGGVIADRESVRLDLGEVSTDLEDLYRAADDAAIVAAYTGEFLPDDVYEDWTGPPRDDARSRFIGAARRLAQRASDTGDHARAATVARRLIEADRYDDTAHRMLIDALMRANEPGEAKRAHAAYATAMQDLDITVDPWGDADR